MEVLPLAGCTIGITADRRRQEQAELLQRRGAVVREGPVIKTVPLQCDDSLHAAIQSLIDCPPEIFIATTGIGIRAFMAAAQAAGLESGVVGALSASRIAARGPKAAGAIQAAGLEVWWQEPSEQLDAMLQTLIGQLVPGTRVALQRYGHPVPWAIQSLEEAGANVLELPIYQWTLPEDRAPAYRLIEAACQQQLDAITLTSPPSVDNLFRLAADIGAVDRLRRALNSTVQAVCVGPMSGAAAEAHGVTTAAWPERGRLGLMVRTLTDRLEQRHLRLRVDGGMAVLQGSSLVHPEGVVHLSDRERAVLQVVARRPGAVFSRTTLLKDVWGDLDADDHLIDVTMARLRRRLDTTALRLVTVPRRGYRLEGAAPN
jgi:uroporphyrinogen-III synthase